MSPQESIQAALAENFPVFAHRDGVRVTTHCMYPSNGFVQVIVRGGRETFFVSDEGRGIGEIEAAGGEVRNPDKTLSHLVTPYGLLLVNGEIRSQQCAADELAVAIALVANASRNVAEWLFEHSRIERPRNFKSVVRRFLRTAFDDNVQNAIVVGASNKPHKFDNVIMLPRGRRLIVDPVVPDPQSVNAKVVAHLDVRKMGYSDLEQRIVYDDEEEWDSSDLVLLSDGATVVPFSKAPAVLSKLAQASESLNR